MVGTNQNQNVSSSQKSLEDRIDYDKLGAYAPEDEIEERMLEMALNSLEQAMELNQEYIDSIRNPYDETREMIKQYKEFYEETGHAMDPEVFTDLWSTGESPDYLKSMRDTYWDLAQSGIETYLELKEENDIEQFYEDWLEEESEEEEVVQQEGIQDMVDQFMNNPANKN